MNEKKLIKALIWCCVLVFALAGIAVAAEAARIGQFVNGAEVEGTVYDYEVRYSDSRYGGKYHCFLYCSYEDEAGRIYKTEFQYNMSGASREDAEDYGKKLLNSPVTLYFNGKGCISEADAKRYVPYVAISVTLFVAGAAVACVQPVISAVKKKREKFSGLY